MSWLERFRGRTPSAFVGSATRMEQLLQQRDEQTFAAVGSAPRKSQFATPTAELAGKVVPSFDPLWFHNGVFVFEPAGARRHWLYATAGLSTPWHLTEPGELFSGALTPSAVGYELSMATPEESDLPIRILNVLMLASLGVWSAASPAACLRVINGSRCGRWACSFPIR